MQQLKKDNICTKCGKSYVSISSLRRHIRMECGVEPTIKCPYCPYQTRYISSVKKHLSRKHFSK